MVKKSNIILLLIILVALFFRLYNFDKLLYWDLDDEVFFAVLRHIAWDRSPTLLIPNAFLEIGQGPYFHWFSAVLFTLTGYDPVRVRLFPALLGVICCFLVYLAGKMIVGRKLGYVASALYATSFFISFTDRRLWPLTLNSFLSVLTLYIFLNILKKKYSLIPLLAIPVGFAFHSEPSLLVLGIAIGLAWILYRIPLPGRKLFLFLLILSLFFLPFVLAEIRYDGAVSGPLYKSFSKRFSGVPVITGTYYHSFTPADIINSITRTFLTEKSTSIETQLCHLKCNYPLPLFYPISPLLISLLLVLGIIFFVREKGGVRPRLLLLWISFISFLIGEILWNKVFKGNLSQNHFSLVFPTLALLMGYILTKLLKKNAIIFSALGVYAVVNFYQLANSSVKYPLPGKVNVVKTSLDFIGKKNYALYLSGSQMVEGWTELFLLYGHPPVSSNWYEFFEWMYQSFSLIRVSKPNPEESTISVIIKKQKDDFFKDVNYIKKLELKDIEINFK